MRIERRITTAGQSPYASIPFRKAVSEIRNPDGSVVFRLEGIDVPEAWSQVACDVLAQKYFRKAGVPKALRRVEENGVPSFLWRSVTRRGGALPSARGRAHRLRDLGDPGLRPARRLLDLLGLEGRLLLDEDDAAAFHDELRAMLARQMVGANSPQWFNTGLHWAYGIDGPAQGHYYVDHGTGELTSRPRLRAPAAARLLHPVVADDLVNEGGIMDLWVREGGCSSTVRGRAPTSRPCGPRTRSSAAAASRRA